MKRFSVIFFALLLLAGNQLLAQSIDLLNNSTEDGDFSEYTIAQTGIWTGSTGITIWPSNSSWFADGATGGGASPRTCIRVHNVETGGNYYSKYHYLNMMMDESFSTNTVYGTSVLWRKLTGLTPGATYTFSFYHKMTNALAGKSINFAITDGVQADGAYTLGTDGNTNSFVKQLNGIVTFSTTETVYAQTSYTFTVPEGKTEVYAVFLRSHKTNKTLTGTMRINIDDMRLYLGQDQVVESSKSITIDKNISVNSITLNPGAKLAINSGMTLTATNGITLQSDATGTATLLNNGTYSGTINAQQYLGAARNWYVCSPISNATSPSTNITRYYEYVEPGDNADFSLTGSTVYWKGLNTGITMAIGKGYIAQASAGTTVQFSGTANNGDITTTFDLTRNDTKGKGFNLVGNPYPSYLDWVDVAAANTNLDNTYYYRTKNSSDAYTFVTWNGAGSSYVVSNGSLPVNSTVTRYIPPTQAFWVRVKTGTSATKMNFTNAMREHCDDNENLMKAKRQETRTSVRLQLQNGTESDELFIYQDAAASNSYDAYDSPKMLNNSTTIPDLYCITGDERLVINGLNVFGDNTELPLGFGLNATTTLKFKASELNNLPEGIKLYLRDKQENSETELTPATEYAFSTTATANNESRFSLLFKAPGVTTGTTNKEREQVSVFVNTQNQITIIAKPNSNYSIYNAVGQLIENGVLNSGLLTTNSKQQTGIFVVKVNNQSTRVIIK